MMKHEAALAERDAMADAMDQTGIARLLEEIRDNRRVRALRSSTRR
jgi:hypothetical protein